MNRKFLPFALIALLDLQLRAAPPPSATFAPPVNFPLGSRVPVSLALGDFEGDGMRDIAVAFSNGTQTILRNRTIGVAAPRTSSIDVSPLISPAGGADVVFGDLNKDGVDDWITTFSGANRLAITPGGPVASSSPTVPRPPREIRLADVDGDGNLDIIIGYDQTSLSSILRGRGDATVANAIDVIVGGGPALAVVDWNGDGGLDIVAGSGGPARVSVAFNTGALTFAAPQVVASLPGTSGAFVEGIAVRSRSSTESAAALAISVRDNATGQRTLYLLQADDPSGAVPIATSNGSIHATFADLNRDGRTDLVIVDSEARKLVVRAGTADGSLPVIAQVDLPPVDVTAAVVGDVSGDGVPDVLIGSADGTISVYVNTTAPTRHRAARH